LPPLDFEASELYEAGAWCSEKGGIAATI